MDASGSRCRCLVPIPGFYSVNFAYACWSRNLEDFIIILISLTDSTDRAATSLEIRSNIEQNKFNDMHYYDMFT